MKRSQITPILLTASLLLAMTLTQLACKSTSGEVGPAGATGATGAAGPTGPQGPSGTANVTQISFGSRTHNGTDMTYTLPGITTDMVNKSSVFVYLQNSIGSWYPIPGIFNGTFEYRTYVVPNATSSTVRVIRVGTTATTTETFYATRVLIIPAATLVNGRQAASAVDFTDYLAVKRYYHLAD